MGARFTLDTDQRARHIVTTAQFSTIDFCKSFWFMSESKLMQTLVINRFCPTVEVNQLIQIAPEKMQVKSVRNQLIDIPIPDAHGAPFPIQVRLISAKGRPGQPNQNDYSESPVSDCLIIHCHGGGFVAQSSLSHECVSLTFMCNILFALDK